MCECEASRHPGKECGSRFCHCHGLQCKITVPIKLDGFLIGKAEISPDGQIITSELEKSHIGQEIREALILGLADSISIKANYVPVQLKNSNIFEADRNARAYGFEIGRGQPIVSGYTK